MKYCMYCRTELLDNAKFCPNCSTPVGAASPEEGVVSSVTAEAMKCPNCGAPANSLTIICPYCSSELRHVERSKALKDFANQIESLDKKKKGKYELNIGNKSISFGKTDNVEETIIDLIQNYPIPHTVKDIYDFMILACSNIYLDYNINDADPSDAENKKRLHARNEAWKSKMDQAYEKARTAFGREPEFDCIKELYEVKISELNKAKRIAQNPVKRFEAELASIEGERYKDDKIGVINKIRQAADSNFAERVKAEKRERIDNQIINLIKTFSVPNTIEDIQEFLIYVSGNINYDLISGDLVIRDPIERTVAINKNEAWLARFEQLYHQAELSFRNERDFVEIKEIYDKTTYKINAAKDKKKNKRVKKTVLIVLLVVAGIILHILIFGLGSLIDIDAATVSEQNVIQNTDY